MLIKDINQLNMDETVNDFIGRLTKVHPPKEQTEKQKQAGIHNQSVEVSSSTGEVLQLRLIKPDIHIPIGDAGKMYQFKSTEAGSMKMCVFKGSYYLELNGKAHCYPIDETVKKEVKVEPAPRDVERKPQPKVELAPVNALDYAEAYADILKRINQSMGRKDDDVSYQAGASTVFIACSNNGALKDLIADKRDTGAQPVDNFTIEDVKEKFRATEKTPKQAENNKIIAKYLLAGSYDDGVGYANANTHDSLDVYDLLVAGWQADDISIDSINAAYDNLLNVMSMKGKKPTTKDVCSAIIRDCENFTLSLTEGQEGNE